MTNVSAATKAVAALAQAKKSPRILPDVAALQARIAELEAAQSSGTKTTTVTLGEYKGKPTLSFEGNFRPFHMGMSKCRVIMDQAEVVKRFIKSNGKSI